MEQFRIDNAYGKVYIFDEVESAYLFYGSFFAIGIDAKIPELKQLGIIEEDYHNNN